MPKFLSTAPCYSKQNYYDFFAIDFSNKSVLDIGSSVGSFKKSKKFDENNLKNAKKYITIDINPDSGADIIADAHVLPFKDSSFDIILANNVIEHFYDPQKAVKEMKRVLKMGGQIYFTVPFLYPVHEAPHDYARFTKFGLQKLFEDFKNVQIYSRGGWFSVNANLVFKITHIFDKIKVGWLVRALLYPGLWLSVKLDRFDKTDAFVRVYFGKAKK